MFSRSVSKISPYVHNDMFKVSHYNHQHWYSCKQLFSLFLSNHCHYVVLIKHLTNKSFLLQGWVILKRQKIQAKVRVFFFDWIKTRKCKSSHNKNILVFDVVILLSGCRAIILKSHLPQEGKYKRLFRCLKFWLTP